MKIKENKKSGFTLAEVLITLAIIGVVAALTLPTMIVNHQKKVYVVQLQKAISTLEQGFKMMMADDAVDRLDYTTLFAPISDTTYSECYMPSYDEDEVCKQFFDAWKKYFNISEISPVYDEYEWKFLDSSGDGDPIGEYGDYFFKFADSMWVGEVYFVLGSGKPSTFSDNVFGQLYIDVNGEKGPNTYGRDIFSLYIQEDGTLVGEGDGTKETCLSSGASCSSYLMNNGWVMDY